MARIKTPEEIEKNLDIIRSKLAFFMTGFNNHPLTIENKSTPQEEWINISIGRFAVVSGPTDFILIPGKLEFHLWECGRKFEQWDITSEYVLTKKPQS